MKLHLVWFIPDVSMNLISICTIQKSMEGVIYLNVHLKIHAHDMHLKFCLDINMYLLSKSTNLFYNHSQMKYLYEYIVINNQKKKQKLTVVHLHKYFLFTPEQITTHDLSFCCFADAFSNMSCSQKLFILHSLNTYTRYSRILPNDFEL